MAANGESQTVSEYIVHHLTNLTYGKLPAGFERYDGSVVPEGVSGQWRTGPPRAPPWALMPSMSIP